jgi:hypothetical protein
MKADITISPIIGPVDPPPIMITAKDGRRRLIRIEMTPESFGLAITGRMVSCEVELPGDVSRRKTAYEECAKIAERAATRCVREGIPGDSVATFVAQQIRDAAKEAS